jgi:hypothetical protein
MVLFVKDGRRWKNEKMEIKKGRADQDKYEVSSIPCSSAYAHKTYRFSLAAQRAGNTRDRFQKAESGFAANRPFLTQPALVVHQTRT